MLVLEILFGLLFRLLDWGWVFLFAGMWLGLRWGIGWGRIGGWYDGRDEIYRNYHLKPIERDDRRGSEGT